MTTDPNDKFEPSDAPDPQVLRGTTFGGCLVTLVGWVLASFIVFADRLGISLPWPSWLLTVAFVLLFGGLLGGQRIADAWQFRGLSPKDRYTAKQESLRRQSVIEKRIESLVGAIVGSAFILGILGASVWFAMAVLWPGCEKREKDSWVRDCAKHSEISDCERRYEELQRRKD